MTVGVLSEGLPPFSFIKARHLSGMGVDFLRDALHAPAQPLQIRIYSNQAALEKAACAREIDLIVDQIQHPEHSHCLKFSTPYFVGSTVIYGRTNIKNSLPKADADPPVRIAALHDTPLEGELQNRYPNAVRIDVADVRSGLEAVASGRADFFTTLQLAADYVISENPIKGISEITSMREPAGEVRFGVASHHPTLLAALNSGLATLSFDQRNAVIGKWAHTHINTPDESVSTLYLSPKEREFLDALPDLRIAFDANRPPYAYLDEYGQPSGIAWHYLSWLTHTLGLQFQRVPTRDLQATANALGENKIDIAAIAVRGNPLWNDLRISQPYVKFPAVIIGRSAMSPIEDLKQLRGKRIAASKLSGMAETLRTQIPDAIWTVEETLQGGLEKVISGDVDVYIGGLAATDAALQHGMDFKGKLHIVGAANAQINIGFALSPQLADKLMPLIDRAITALPEAQRQEILHRYISTQYSSELSLETQLKRFGIPILALLLTVAILSYFLLLYRKELGLRRAVETQLSSQLEFQRTLIDAIPIPMVVYDQDHRYSIVNKAYEQLTHRQRESLLNKTVGEVKFWGPDNIALLENNCAEAIRTGARRTVPLSQTDEHGSMHHYLGHIQPFGLNNNNTGLICLADDITDILNAESRARQAQSRLTLLTRHLPVMVFQARQSKDQVMELLWVSGNTEALLGVTSAELLNDPMGLDKFVHAQDLPQLWQAAHAAQQTLQPLIHTVRVQHNQSWHWIRIHAVPSHDTDMQTLWHGYWMDTTAEREQFELLSQARDHAEQALRAKDSFLSLMSHEIRTPMSGVLGLVELLSHTSLDQEQAAMVGMIEGSAGTLMQILNDILDFSKIESGKIELELLPVNVRELCDMAQGLLAVSAHSKGIKLHMEISEQVAAIVQADGLRLRQILFNLLSNAIKFTEHGTISLTVSVQSETKHMQTLVWSITDTGTGISPEHQTRLFKPFSQADASTTRRFGGTGLGLSICNRLVQLMRGRIELTSTLGQGTQVRVSLPLPVLQARIAPPPLQGVHAYLCLKEAATTRALTELLRAAGAKVSQQASLTSVSLANDQSQPLMFLDEGGTAPAAMQACALVHITYKVKQSGYRLTDDEVRLSANPLSWHATQQAALAALQRCTTQSNPPQTRPPQVPLKSAPAAASVSRILIAEDHDTNRMLLQKQLEQLGLICDAVADGEAAWNALRAGHYDLLLTDCHMPYLNGYDLARRIRTQEAQDAAPRLPILATTANADKAEMQRCLEAGIDATLFKPMRLQALREALSRYITVPDIPPRQTAPR